MAHITKVLTKKGKVRWRVRVSLGIDGETGKRKVLTRTYDRRAEAQAEARKYEDMRDHGGLSAPSREPLGAYLKHWLQDVAKPRVRARTYDDYSAILKRYILAPPMDAPPLRTVKMHQLSPEAIQRVYRWMSEEKGLSPRTVGSLHGVLRSALNQAAATGAISRNPALYVNPPRQDRKEMRAMTEAQAQSFLRAARGDRFHALWALLISTGLRPGETLGLKWTDMEGDRLRVQRSLTRRGQKGWSLVEPKTNRGRRTVVVPVLAYQALQVHRKRQAGERLKAGAAWADYGFMFCTSTGQPLDQTNLYRRNFLAVLEEADLGAWTGEGDERSFTPGFNMYSLRHTAASLAIRAGVGIKTVSAMLGHASVSLTLDTYTHLLGGEQEHVAELMQEALGGAG